MSIKQGLKYDSPASARDIPSFIAFHNLKVDDILEPLDSFSMCILISWKCMADDLAFGPAETFNQFFYR